jgi:hypothetical protein
MPCYRIVEKRMVRKRSGGDTLPVTRVPDECYDSEAEARSVITDLGLANCYVDPTVKMVTGDLVHRACLMPFAKPWHLSARSGRWIHGWDLDGALAESCEQVCTAFNRLIWGNDGFEPNGRHEELIERLDKQLANCIADIGGPWWNALVFKFMDLNSPDQKETLRRVARIAESIRAKMVANAPYDKWRWILGEHATFRFNEAPRSSSLQLDSVRPDLLVGFGEEAEKLAVIDLKTTRNAASWTAYPDDRERIHRAYEHHSLVREAIARKRTVELWFLVGDERRAEWVPVNPPSL